MGIERGFKFKTFKKTWVCIDLFITVVHMCFETMENERTRQEGWEVVD